MKTLDGVLDGIDYHQFYLLAEADVGTFPSYADDEVIKPHGLIASSGHGVCVTAGITMGPIFLTVELVDGPPDAVDDRRQWTAVSELSFEAANEHAWLFTFDGPTVAPYLEPFALQTGPGWYRIRAHAWDRELDFDGCVDTPREYHLLQIWPATAAPATHQRIDNQWSTQPPMP